jgi:hypothetical protein
LDESAPPTPTPPIFSLLETQKHRRSSLLLLAEDEEVFFTRKNY